MLSKERNQTATGPQSHHFHSGEDRYVWLYNQQLPQSALGSKSPLQAMKDWHKIKPELFKKQPYCRPGCDIYQVEKNSGFLKLKEI